MENKIYFLSCLKNYILISLIINIKIIFSQIACPKELNPDESKRSYSSIFDNNLKGTGHARSMLDSPQAWSYLNLDINQWMIIDLSQPYSIISIIIQCRKVFMENNNQYVSSYNLAYSIDDIKYVTILLPFQGVKNFDDASRYYGILPDAIKARYIKLSPVSWVNHIPLRAGILYQETSKTDCVNYPQGSFYSQLETLYKPCSLNCSCCCGSESNCISCTEICNNPPLYYFYSQQEKKYKPCSSKCDCCCGSDSNCISCTDNIYPILGDINNLCINSQQSTSGYLLNNKFFYLKCNEKCLTCSKSIDNCTLCNTPIFYYPIEGIVGDCFREAPDGYFLDKSINDNFIFKKCDNMCSLCWERKDQCKSCNNGYYKLESPGINEINYWYLPDSKPNYFLDSLILKLCDNSCNGCLENKFYCKSCNYGYYRLESPGINEINYCFLPDLKPNYYLDSLILKLCDNSCNGCLENKFYCKSCNYGYYRLESPIIDEINYCYLPDSKPNYFLSNNKTILKLWDNSCLTCENESFNCLKCRIGFYKTSISKAEKLNYCYFKTIGFYTDLEENILKLCDDSCYDCEFNSKNCTICQKNFYKLENAKGENKNFCYKDFIGYYIDKVENLLKLCNKNCSSCETNSNNCVICKNNHYKLEDGKYENKNNCYKEYEGYYIDKEEKLLKKCDKSCFICEKDSNNCINCQNNFFKKYNDTINPNACYGSELSNQGFYIDENDKQWKLCDLSCITCKKLIYNCLYCNEAKNYFKFDFKIYDITDSEILNNLKYDENSKLDFLCVNSKEKIKGIFFDSKKKLFDKCDKSCSQCEDKNICLKNDTDIGHFAMEENKTCILLILI